MALIVSLVDSALSPMPPVARLGFLAFTGAAVYGAWLLAFARPTIDEVVAMVRSRGA
jgi:hypothetical protein